jgi:hypothetical protein
MRNVVLVYSFILDCRFVKIAGLSVSSDTPLFLLSPEPQALQLDERMHLARSSTRIKDRDSRRFHSALILVS